MLADRKGAAEPLGMNCRGREVADTLEHGAVGGMHRLGPASPVAYNGVQQVRIDRHIGHMVLATRAANHCSRSCKSMRS